MNTEFYYVIGSAFLTRQFVQEVKKSARFGKYFENSIAIYALNYITNAVLALAWAFADGKPLSLAFVHGIIQAVISVIYHDINTAISSGSASVPVVSLPYPVVSTPSSSVVTTVGVGPTVVIDDTNKDSNAPKNL